MGYLRLSSKTNQSLTFPPLLVAQWILQHDSQAPQLDINVVEAGNTSDEEKSNVELSLFADKIITGTDNVLNAFLENFETVKGSSIDSVGAFSHF